MVTGTARRRRSVARPADLVAVLALVSLVVTLGLVAAAVRPAWIIRYQTGYQPPAAVPTAVSTWQATGSPSLPPEPSSRTPTGLGGFGFWVGIALGVLALGVAVFLFVRWYRGRSAALRDLEVSALEIRTEPEIPVLQRGAEVAARRLLQGGDPTDAIITAWLALEEAAAASGVPRAPAATPTEFTGAVLSSTGVDAEPVQTLLALYHRARFAASGSRPEDLVTARRCVHDLAEAWRQFTLDAAERR